MSVKLRKCLMSIYLSHLRHREVLRSSEALAVNNWRTRLVDSCLEIHICWNVLKEDKMEPPIHTEYLRSGGATTLIFIVDGARAVSSFVMRSNALEHCGT